MLLLQIGATQVTQRPGTVARALQVGPGVARTFRVNHNDQLEGPSGPANHCQAERPGSDSKAGHRAAAAEKRKLGLPVPGIQ